MTVLRVSMRISSISSDIALVFSQICKQHRRNRKICKIVNALSLKIVFLLISYPYFIVFSCFCKDLCEHALIRMFYPPGLYMVYQYQ